MREIIARARFSNIGLFPRMRASSLVHSKRSLIRRAPWDISLQRQWEHGLSSSRYPQDPSATALVTSLLPKGVSTTGTSSVRVFVDMLAAFVRRPSSDALHAQGAARSIQERESSRNREFTGHDFAAQAHAKGSPPSHAIPVSSRPPPRLQGLQNHVLAACPVSHQSGYGSGRGIPRWRHTVYSHE